MERLAASMRRNIEIMRAAADEAKMRATLSAMRGRLASARSELAEIRRDITAPRTSRAPLRPTTQLTPEEREVRDALMSGEILRMTVPVRFTTSGRGGVR